MARNTSLFLRIGEAKNLPAKDLSGTSDPYCVVKVDNEQVARTATVWRSLCPFWGEEYTLHLPNGFHNLSIYIWDEDILSGDDLIGKVVLTKDMVQGEPKGVEKWLKIMAADQERELEGELYLEIGRYICGSRDFLKLKIVKARELPAKYMTGSTDSFVRITFMETEKQTKAVKANRFPEWHEVVEFDIPNMSKEVMDHTNISLTVCGKDRIGGEQFLGNVSIRLADLRPNYTFDQWFRLLPKESETVSRKTSTVELGSVRIRARLSEERILPSHYYQPLIDILMDSVSPDKHKISGPTPLRMLQEVMTLDLMEVANTLVKLYLGHGKIVPYLDVICTEEIQNTSNPNTLFRGNSLATKSVDQFMKIVGMPYLHETIGPVIEHIYEEHRLVELDPGRIDILREYDNYTSPCAMVGEGSPQNSVFINFGPARECACSSRRPSLKSLPKDKDVIEVSTNALLAYLHTIRSRVMNSVNRIPPIMRLVFKVLRQRIEERWPGTQHEDHKYVGISGFLILRFFAPAILSPKLFSLQEYHPDAKTSRTLTLVAKAIQNMGNLGLQLGLGKEQWMTPLHPFIKDSINDIKQFIDRVIQVDEESVSFDMTRRRSVFHPSVTIKQGFLWKRSLDKIKFVNSFTFKKRYFWLKYDTVSYAKTPTDSVRNNIPISQVCAVERVDKQAFSKSNMGQVITRSAQGQIHILYFQAKDINNMYSWISSIRKTIIMNEGLLDMYHPGTIRKNKWTCCSRAGRQGCSQTYCRVTIGDWRDPLDPDVEAQTIYSQLIQGRDILRQKYVESQEAVKEAVQETVKSLQQQEKLWRQTGDQLSPHSPRSLCSVSSFNAFIDAGSPNSPNFLQPPASPVFLGITNDVQHAALHKSTSFQDAQLASAAQLLDVIRDLERAHEAFEHMERERARNSLRNED